jgi:hypothetical protein
MIYCKELNKNFSNEKEMFAELIANKEFIIKEKTSQIYKSFEKGLAISVSQENISKALEMDKTFKIDNDFYYFVVNSSNILDSHADLHVKKNWEKTVKEQQRKVFLVFDHQLKRSEIIAMKEDIEMFTSEIPFSLIGKNYDGNTYCLIYKVKKDKIVNAEAKEWLDKGYSLEASVRMQYVNIDLAVKSKEEDYKKENETYEKYFPLIANKEDFKEEINYFWVVKEAKNVHESSLVLFGSNSATGIVQENKNTQAEQSLENIEAEKSLQTQKRKLFIN